MNIFGTIISILLGLITVVAAASKIEWVQKAMDNLTNKLIGDLFKKKKDNNKKLSESDVLSHEMFTLIDNLVSTKLPTICFRTEYRTVIFRKYIKIYLKAYKIHLKNFVKSREFLQMSQPELWSSVIDLYRQIYIYYEKEMLNSGVPMIVITQMRQENIENHALMIDLFDCICNCDFYDSDGNLLKVYSILNITLTILENSLLKSVNTLDSIGDELKGFSIQVNGRIITEP